MRYAHLPLLVASAVLVAAPASAESPDVKKSLCDGRADCKIRWSKDAGTDHQKRSMRVIDIGLAGDVDYDQAQQECHPHELWLVVGDKKVEERQLIAELCNDGYGSRMMGEDTIEVRPNRLRVSQTGGSSWMWSSSWEIELSPSPRIIAEATDGQWTLGLDNMERAAWSWTTFSGESRWTAPACGNEKLVRTGRYAALPVVEAPKQWDWKKTSLGECAVRLDATSDPKKLGGGVVHGKRSHAKDAALRVVGISPTEFVVEITDDIFHTKAKSWVKQDHVEMWIGESQGYMDHCLGKGRAEQWGITLDGKVIAAHNKPKSKPNVEVARTGNIVRMRIRLPEAPPMLTFVYSDSDDGKSQERLIATSALEFGKNHTLGHLRQIASSDAVCRVEDGTLVVKRPNAKRKDPLVKP